MYKEFKLGVQDASIMGHHWGKENPSHVLVLIHGIGEHAGRFHRVATMCNAENIAVVAMDLRGHGCSSGARGHTAPRTSILEDVETLMQWTMDQYPHKKIIVYGHSMGGNIVLDYRNRGKFSAIPVAYVASSPWIVLKRKVPKILVATMEVLSKVKPKIQLSAGIKPKQLGNKLVISKHLHPALLHNKITAQTARECYKIGLALKEGTGEKAEVNGCHLPLLLMHGSSDKICSVEGSRQIAKLEKEKCHYVEWKNYFHEIHNGTKDEDGSEPIKTLIQWIQEL